MWFFHSPVGLDTFSLNTKKYYDYLLFKQVVLLMVNKEHTTLEGIQKIVSLKSSLNWGLTTELKNAFPDIASSNNLESFIIKTADQKLDKILHPEWIAGFATGESNFFISVRRVRGKSKNKSGFTTTLRFSIAQHSRDLLLLENLIEVLLVVI